MFSTRRRAPFLQTHAHDVIVRELEDFLRGTRIRRVYFAEASVAPPLLAYVTHFPRLSITLEGCHSMDVAYRGRKQVIKPLRGQAVFVPDHAWNKPDWATAVKVLTFLFGAMQIGISLVHHRCGSDAQTVALKTSVPGAYDALTHGILVGLMASASDNLRGPLDQLLIESLLHSCLKLLKTSPTHGTRKALRTYESICLYVQENVQNPITRESVALQFGLAPSHVSRLFRREGMMRFNDYLNLVRVTRAKLMLRSYNLTVKEIAANCGYAYPAYFCRTFKKICKVTPTQFRSDLVSPVRCRKLLARTHRLY
jgi:AraC-like DNA-binding protein